MFVGNKKYEILTDTGWSDFDGVSAKGSRQTFLIKFEDGLEIRATHDHQFFKHGVLVKLQDLIVGDTLDSLNGPTKICSIEEYGFEPVYDIFNVKNKQHSFCLENSILSKNCDEFAYVPKNKSEDFWVSMQPTLSTGGSCIVTSTPNSDDDQFAQIWHGAIDTFDEYGNEREDGLGSNGFYGIKVKWDEHPDRDDKWAHFNKMQLGEEKFRREFNCDFITADDTLINPLTLNTLQGQDEIFKIDQSRWFQEPRANSIYGIALDPAIGAGQGDFAAIQVYDLVNMDQVAEWRSSSTMVPGQIEMLIKILYYLYQTMSEDPAQVNEPEIYWTVENNSLGEAALVVIDETGEENFPGFFVHEPRNGRRRKGLTTTNKNKMAACSRMKSLVESRRMKVKSKPLIRELKHFVASRGSFGSKVGEHDDLVSATLLVIRILHIIAHWDPEVNEKLSDAVEMEEMEIAPMPFIM